MSSPGLLPPGTYCAPLLQTGKDAAASCAWRWRARALAAARRRWSPTQSTAFALMTCSRLRTHRPAPGAMWISCRGGARPADENHETSRSGLRSRRQYRVALVDDVADVVASA